VLPVRVPLHRLVIALALIFLMQGPALLVQQIGWVSMLARYTSEGGLTQGIRETFDGSRPCSLCHAAEAIRKSQHENEEAPRVETPRFQAVPIASVVRAPKPAHTPIVAKPRHGPDVARLIGLGRDAPPVPPPEFA